MVGLHQGAIAELEWLDCTRERSTRERTREQHQGAIASTREQFMCDTRLHQSEKSTQNLSTLGATLRLMVSCSGVGNFDVKNLP